MHISFVIIGAPRTGTNLITHMLADAFPTFLCFNEVFNAAVPPISEDGKLWGYDRGTISALAPELDSWITQDRLARRFQFGSEFVGMVLESRYAETVQFVGMKMLYDHLYQIDNVARLLTDVEKRGTLFIHVRRRDLLAQYYSLKIAERTGVWLADQNNPYNPTEAERKIQIYVPDLLIYFGMYIERERLVSHLLRRQIILKVDYEDFLRDRAGEVYRIREHLGYQGSDLAPVTYVQNTRDLSKVIENFDDVMKALRKCMIAERFA